MENFQTEQANNMSRPRQVEGRGSLTESGPKRNTPRDVFLHLLAIIMLYWSAISFITILWQTVNRFLPDPLRYSYGYPYYAEPMRVAVASLIIVFPVYILISWFLDRNYKKHPIFREMKLRKWLIYFTLFIAALVIISDLVSVILNFLSGDTTLRFLLKAAAVLFVACLIFGYYLYEARRKEDSKNLKYFVYFVCLIVAISIVGSFFIIGSPKTVRQKQYDMQRINDLQGIQYQIVNFWQRKERLPNNLSELEDQVSGFEIPVDPETKKSYEYAVKDFSALSFELCADFTFEAQNEFSPVVSAPTKDLLSSNWDHSAGENCFERTIDKELYPPLNTK